eukprot:gene20179-22154_t
MTLSLASHLEGRISLTVVAIVVTIANSIVIIVYFFNKLLQNIANRFVLSLAVSDLLVGCILIPLMAWKPLSPAVGPITSLSLWASLTNLCGCTYDRYNAIKNPLLYSAIMTNSRFTTQMFVIWIVPIVFAALPQIWLINPSALNMGPTDVAIAMRIYIGCMTSLVMIICLALIAIYIYIFSVAKKHYNAMKRMQPVELSANESVAGTAVTSAASYVPATAGRRKSSASIKKFFATIKSTILFALIGINFVLCWLPLIIINLFLALDLSHLLSIEFVNVAEIFMYANSLLNPIVYAFFQKRFRSAVARCFCVFNSVHPSQSIFSDVGNQ